MCLDPRKPESRAVLAAAGRGGEGVMTMNDVASRPTVVCLCGSTRFKDAFIAANRDETLAGRIVLSVGLFGHQEGIDMNGPVKVMLDQLHFKKIDLADEILVLNCGGYVGPSTRNEIAYATAKGKRVRYLEPIG